VAINTQHRVHRVAVRSDVHEEGEALGRTRGGRIDGERDSRRYANNVAEGERGTRKIVAVATVDGVQLMRPRRQGRKMGRFRTQLSFTDRCVAVVEGDGSLRRRSNG